MVKVLERPERGSSTGEKVMDSLSAGLHGISELFGSYQRQKQIKKAADYLGLEGSKKEAWDSLPMDMQEKLLPQLFTQMGKRSEARAKQREKLPDLTAKRLKEFHPALYDKLEAKQKISDLAAQFYDEDLSENEAVQRAIEEYQKPKEGVLEQTGLSNGNKKEGWSDVLSRILTEAQQGKAGEHPITLLEREKPGATLGSVGLGAVAPIEEALRYQSPAGKQFIEELGFTYPEGSERGPLVTEKLREKLHAGLSPEAKKSSQFGEIVGAFLPIERVLGGLKNIGKSAEFLKNAEKVAAAEGIGAAEAAQKILKEAEGAGINLEKAAAGDKQEAGKLFNLSNRMSVRKAPATATERRVGRLEPGKKLFPAEERMAAREAQLKAFPKYEEEIAKDAAERATRAESRVAKTSRGMEAQKLRIAEAEKNLPKAQESYAKSLARVRALEEEAAKIGGSQKESVEGLLDAAKNDLRDSEFGLKQALENLKGESVRGGLEDMRRAAQEKMLEIADKIGAGEEIKLAKSDYNPERIKEAKRLESKKQLPSTPKEDFYQQVHKEYESQYKKRLDSVEKQLKELPKSMAEAESLRNLQKERDVLKKLIEQTQADQTIHRHQLALRETAERHKAQQRLRHLTKTEGSPKVQKIAQERFEEAFKNPEGEAAENLAKEAGAKKEDFKEAKSEFKESWEKVKEESAKTKKKTKSAKEPKEAPPAGKDLKKELLRTLRNIQKKRFFHIFMRTPVGREILYSLATATANDVFSLKINPYLQASVGRRIAMYPVRAAVNQIYHWINPKKQIFKHRYKKAVEEENDQAVAKMRKEHPSWVKEARSSLFTD